MNVYIIIILFLLLCFSSVYEIVTGSTGRLIAVLILGLFILCVATRSITSPDTGAYTNAYEVVDFENMRYGDFNIGFIWVICLFKAFGFRVEVFFGFIALINYFICYYVCKNIFNDYIEVKNTFLEQQIRGSETAFKPCIFSALFIPYFGLFYSGAGIRASIAMSLVMLSYLFLYRHRCIAYVLTIAIAMYFHSSAILGLVLILCDKFTLHKKYKYILLWMGIVLLWLLHASRYIIRLVPGILQQLYALTQITSFKIYELFYASLVRTDAFWGKKELFFLICGFVLVFVEWDKSKIYHKGLTPFFGGILLMFALSSITNAYRICDFFLLFIVPCGCIHFMHGRSLYRIERQCVEILILITSQIIIAVRMWPTMITLK